MLKTGDPVGFKNEKHEGIVTKVLTGGFIEVAIEDGFEIKVHENELFLLPETKQENKSEDVFTSDEASSVSTQSGENIFSTVPYNEVCLIFAPSEENKVLTGNVAFYLVNRSDFDLLIHVSSCDDANRLSTLYAGVIRSQQETFIGKSAREQLVEIRNLKAQIIFFNNETFEFRQPFIKDIPVLIPDINERKKSDDYRVAFSKTFTIVDMNEPDEIYIKDLIENFGNVLPGSQSQKKTPVKTQSMSGTDALRYGVIFNSAEVDLHIEELSDDVKNLSNAEIISLQLGKFHSELNSAIQKHYQSITFIHGVGDGVLKKALRSELKNYPGISYKDADPAKYGAGATVVFLK